MIRTRCCRLNTLALPVFIAGLLLLGFLLAPTSCQAQPAIAKKDPLTGYSDYASLQKQLHELAASKFVTVESLGKTLQDRDVSLITISSDPKTANEKPAIAIIGGVDAGHLLGTEIALHIAKHLVADSKHDETRDLLRNFTIYVIPRPSPDATEKCFALPRRRPQGNARKTDDDRDHTFGEDPPEDLNGDGVITMMRVADAAGEYIAHPKDPRVLIKADRLKGEAGQYHLYVEGVDNDHDDKWNEDAGDGVAFNRNFTFKYPYFKAHAGPHQVSENETRAVADFLFDRTNIAAVLSFTPEDNLMQTWKTGKNPTRIPVFVDGGDLKYVASLAKDYRELLAEKNAPGPAKGSGSFSRWAYFHYGRWSLAARGWWVPKQTPADDKKKSDDKRGADDLNALRWMDANNIDGFAAWQSIDHPDFPGKQVEVGGFKPFWRDNPPATEIEALAGKHVRFLGKLVESMPKIAIHETEVESLGAGVFRVHAKVINTGYLPTSSELGRRSRQTQRVQIALDMPEGAELIRGPVRIQLQPIAGSGGTQEHTWLLRVRDKRPRKTTIRAWAAPVGEHTVEIELK